MINFSVKPDGADEYEVVATSRDVLQWERGSKGRSFGSLMDDLLMADLFKLAYLASTRQGFYTGREEQFNAEVDLTFKGLGEVGNADPTKKAR